MIINFLTVLAWISILLVVFSIMPSSIDYPLPAEMVSWFVVAVGYFKAIVSLPIISHVWDWILSICLWFLVPIAIWNLIVKVLSIFTGHHNTDKLEL